MGVNSTHHTPTAVVLTGTAQKGTVGPPISHVDIGISKSAYLFRVALPGVRKDDCKFVCLSFCSNFGFSYWSWGAAVDLEHGQDCFVTELCT